MMTKNRNKETYATVTQARLKEVLSYDPATGIFRWKVSTSRIIKVGAQAGAMSHSGYRYICVDHRIYKANRLAWFYMTGQFPEKYVDHKDLDKTNDRWLNLRLADCSQSAANRGAFRNGTSGFKGVSWREDHKKWGAHIGKSNRKRHLGYFDTREEAALAYRDAAEKLHGEFGRAA